jgi:SAM-dependent methyltransferase
LAVFKATTVNRFVEEHSIGSVIEIGCGDGNQVSLGHYPQYLGLDIAPTAVEMCRNRFANDPHKRFDIYKPAAVDQCADLTLSMDVIFHLVEDDVFDQYMTDLFAAAQCFVAIYGWDFDEPWSTHVAFVRGRRLSRWIQEQQPEWELFQAVENPYRGQPPEDSRSDFYFFVRREMNNELKHVGLDRT